MRWIIRARCDYGDREYLTAVISVNAGEGGPGLQEAMSYGYDVLEALGGTGIEEPGDKLSVQVERASERGE